MLSQLKKDCALHWDSLLMRILIMPLPVLLLGLPVVMIVMGVDKETSFVCLGTMISLLLHVMLGFLWAISMLQEFGLALSMGRTRKEFLFSYGVRSLLAQAGAYLLMLLMYLGELGLYSRMYPYAANEKPLWDILTNGWVIAALIPGMTLVQMLLGLLVGTYGKTFQAVIWLMWMGICVLGPRLLDSESTGRQLLGRAASWGSAFPRILWVAVAACAAVAMLWGIRTVGKKQMVK